MNRNTILSIATMCGAAAFLWTLTMRPPTRPAAPAGGLGGAMREFPRDRRGLEDYVLVNRDDGDAWFLLADLRRNDGDLTGPRSAQNAWQRTVELASERTGEQPDDARAWFELAWSSEKINDAANAALGYKHALDLYESMINGGRMPTSWRLWHRVGWCRAKRDDPAGAAEAWGTAATMLENRGARGGNGELTLWLIRDLALLNRTDEALDLLERSAPYWDPAVLEHDECLSSIRGTDRFRAAALRAQSQPLPSPRARVFTGG
jgi:hypothetical protein